MSDARYLLDSSGIWQPTGSVTVTPPPSSTKPSSVNTGAGSGLTHYTAATDFITTSNGQVISGLNIDGRILIRHSNVHVSNCWPHGSSFTFGTSNSGLIDNNFGGTTGLVVDKCTLICDTAQVTSAGIIGHEYTITNCNIGNVVDGIDWYETGNVNIVAKNNYVHDLTVLGNDPNHVVNGKNTNTHNDGSQGQGGGIVLIQNNNFSVNPSSLSTYHPSPSGATIQGLAVTPNVSQVNHLTVDSNWFDYGKVGIVMIPGPDGTGAAIVITNNRFGRNLATINNGGRTGQHPIIIDPAVTVVGFSSSSGLDTTNGNVWDDDGSPVYIDRATP